MVFVSRREDNSARMPGIRTGKGGEEIRGPAWTRAPVGAQSGPIPNWEWRESIRHESVAPGVAAEESGKKSAG
jgi:hypothetical protein